MHGSFPRSHIVLVAVGLPIGLVACMESQPDIDAPYAAVVTRSEARFVFPVPERDTWPIDLPETPNNAQEYAWEIEVQNEGQEYRFGYSRYKHPSSAQREVGSSELLGTQGQVNVWKIDTIASTMPAAGVYLESIAADRIAIWITDAETVNELFSGRPDSVTFHWHTPLDTAGSRRVAVSYLENQATRDNR